MTITTSKANGVLTIELDGRLDTNSAPELEEKLEASITGVKKLIYDLKKLRYVSSAGLRVLLTSVQLMARQGEMTVRNVCYDVLDVFEITGFIEHLNIEQR